MSNARSNVLKKNDGYVMANRDNIPFIDSVTLAQFFSSGEYHSCESGHWKDNRAARESYGDEAIGYVQLKRVDNLCFISARITPEHRTTSPPYEVELLINEEDQTITSATCKCTASNGGCKHMIAIVTWLHQRSGDKTRTDEECYWKKAKLSKVADPNSFVTAEDFCSGRKRKRKQVSHPTIDRAASLQNIVDLGKQAGSTGMLFQYFRDPNVVDKLDIHVLIQDFLKKSTSQGKTSFCLCFLSISIIVFVSCVIP